MRATLECHIASGYTPGLVGLVYHRGREHVEAMGTMAFDSNVPMRRDWMTSGARWCGGDWTIRSMSGCRS